MDDLDRTDAHVLACSLAAWARDPWRCRWCNTLLEGRRRRWCSDECSAEYTRQHLWTWARNAALKRDGDACVECGAHSEVVEGRFVSVKLEVHHRDPILGKHSAFGCWHHVDGLVTLCHDHHLAAHARLAAQDDAQLSLGLAAA